MALPAVKEKLTTWGVETRTMTTPEYTKFVATQIDVWRPLIIDAGAQEKSAPRSPRRSARRRP